MAKNKVQEGKVLRLPAPYAVSSGAGALVGAIFGVALTDIGNGEPGDFEVEGVWSLAKATSQAWSAGDRIYWDNSAKNCTTVKADNTFVGVATAAAASNDTTGYVRLSGANDEGAADAAIADLQENGGAIGGTNDGNMPAAPTVDLSGWNGSAATTAGQATDIQDAIVDLGNMIREVGAKQNAILAALRQAGVIASS